MQSVGRDGTEGSRVVDVTCSLGSVTNVEGKQYMEHLSALRDTNCKEKRGEESK